MEFTHSGTTLHRTFTFLLRPNPEKYINVTGIVSVYPSGARLYIERESSTSSILLSGDEQEYSIYVEKDLPFRLYVQYNDEVLYEKTFTASSADILHHIIVNYAYYINWSTSLPVVDGYIEVD